MYIYIYIYIYICGKLKSRQPRHQNSKLGLDTTLDVFLLAECFNFSISLKFLTRVTFLGCFSHFLGDPSKSISVTEGMYLQGFLH